MKEFPDMWYTSYYAQGPQTLPKKITVWCFYEDNSESHIVHRKYFWNALSIGLRSRALVNLASVFPTATTTSIL